MYTVLQKTNEKANYYYVYSYLIAGLSELSSDALWARNLGSSPGSECSRSAQTGSS